MSAVVEANALVQSLSTESKKVEMNEMEVTIAKLKDQVQVCHYCFCL